MREPRERRAFQEGGDHNRKESPPTSMEVMGVRTSQPTSSLALQAGRAGEMGQREEGVTAESFVLQVMMP